MRLFNIKPQIYGYKKLNDFFSDFNVTKKDLVFTIEPLYEQFIRHNHIEADFIFLESFGIGEPTDTMIDSIKDSIDLSRFKRIIGIGGGSVIDIAKLLCLSNNLCISKIAENISDLKKEKELVIIPTTCGTGSEVTNISVVSFEKRGTKKGIVSDTLYADFAVLVPELLEILPYNSFIFSSIDAFIHAAESFLAPKSSIYTDMFCLEAMKDIINGYMLMVNKGKNCRFEVFEKFLFASNFAGIAFNITGVAAVHALSYPFGSKLHVAHGESNYVFFTEVFKTYTDLNPGGKIAELNKYLKSILGIRSPVDAYTYLEENIFSSLFPKKRLADYGVRKKDIKIFTDKVVKEQQRLLANNYLFLSEDNILNIYNSLY